MGAHDTVSNDKSDGTGYTVPLTGSDQDLLCPRSVICATKGWRVLRLNVRNKLNIVTIANNHQSRFTSNENEPYIS
jgi:hypothetical protein